MRLVVTALLVLPALGVLLQHDDDHESTAVAHPEPTAKDAALSPASTAGRAADPKPTGKAAAPSSSQSSAGDQKSAAKHAEVAEVPPTVDAQGPLTPSLLELWSSAAGLAASHAKTMRMVRSGWHYKLVTSKSPTNEAKLDITLDGIELDITPGLLVMLVLTGLYFWVILQHYPMKPRDKLPNEASKKMQSQSEVLATCEASPSNICLSFCCPVQRQAHTTHILGVQNYWVGALLMTFCPCPMCPCPMLWYHNSCTSLKEELGGKRRGCCSGCVTAWCCSCCVITQNAESLDRMMDLRTGIFGVEKPDQESMV